MPLHGRERPVSARINGSNTAQTSSETSRPRVLFFGWCSAAVQRIVRGPDLREFRLRARIQVPCIKEA